MVYKWSTGIFASVDANDAGKEFDRIEKKCGELTSRNLLNESKSDKALFHNLFEWDDAVAGEKYRLHQASQIICALISSPSEEELQESNRRAYVNIETNRNNGAFSTGRYMAIETAMADEEMRNIVLRDAMRELAVYQSKYEHLEELAKIFEAADEVRSELNM